MPGISTSEPEPEAELTSPPPSTEVGTRNRSSSSSSLTALATLYLDGGARSPFEQNGDALRCRGLCCCRWDVSVSSYWLVPDSPRSGADVDADGEDDGHASISDIDDSG
jgi:hypothetical protein